MNSFFLPDALRELLRGQTYWEDTVGLSDSRVLLFPDKVLKIRPVSRESRCEARMMRWLRGRLPVPDCLYHGEAEGTDYLLMTRVPGTMACDEEWMRDPEKLVSALAEALRELWATDITDCPADWSLSHKLAAAEARVAAGNVDLDDVEPETFGESGFQDPAHLLQWLKEHRPEEDPVLSHGDFCLPNVFLEDGRLSGLIDLGRMGVADRWQDLALCYRSLRDNYAGVYTGIVWDGFDPESLFRVLDLSPNWEKIRYYLLLDELF